MTTTYTHITDVNTDEIVLKKDGTILLNKVGYKKQTIGNWSVSYPRKDAKAKGLIAKEWTERTYDGGIPYKGKAFGYTRTEFKEGIINIIKHYGIDIE